MVDFPPPDGPTRQSASPGAIWMETSASTVALVSYSRLTPSSAALASGRALFGARWPTETSRLAVDASDDCWPDGAADGEGGVRAAAPSHFVVANTRSS